MKCFQPYLHLFILLSLTTTSSAIQYAKTGCNDTCGNNVRIPYPFGIGAGCSVNQWYIVDCSNSTPYLSALNRLEVLGVNMDNQTVTVSMPRIYKCEKQVRVDLGGSPFLFSKSNKFVFEGCGIASMKMDDGSVIIGCSTTCRNDTLGDRIRSNCFGIGCCQTEIPNYLKSYNINITGLKEEDEGCGYTFLVNETSYDPFDSKNSSFTPVSLLWTLTDSDHITCCHRNTLLKREVILFNDNPLVTLKCTYYAEVADNPYLGDGSRCREYAQDAKYAKTGCKEKCGNVTIPFPFGIGASCSVNQWYIVDCKNSTPYLPALNHLQVLGVSLGNQTVTVSTPRITNCQRLVRNSTEIMGVDLGGSPFWFSKPHNKFVFEGCGIAALMDKGNVLTGCTTACRGVTLRDRNKCFGMGCCQTPVPHYLKSFSINITGLEEEEEDGGCGSSFLVDEISYDQRRNATFIPISLMWTLTDSDRVTCCYDQTPVIRKMEILNGTTVDKWECTNECYRGIGNPYLVDGCQSYGGEETTEECRRCYDNGGYCSEIAILDVDDLVVGHNSTCYNYHDGQRTSLGVILGSVFYSKLEV